MGPIRVPVCIFSVMKIDALTAVDYDHMRNVITWIVSRVFRKNLYAGQLAGTKSAKLSLYDFLEKNVDQFEGEEDIFLLFNNLLTDQNGHFEKSELSVLNNVNRIATDDMINDIIKYNFKIANFVNFNEFIDEFEYKLKTLFNKFYDLLKSYAQQIGVLKVKVDEPKGGSLGKIAFGELRDMPEKDTEIEARIVDYLKQHFKGEPMIGSVAKEISSLLKARKYRNYLRGPETDAVYRGMLVSGAWLRQHVKSPGYSGEAEVNMKFVPIDVASSWSQSIDVAERFSRRHSDKTDMYYVVLCADPFEENEGKFLDCLNLYSLFGAATYIDEVEAIGFGEIAVNKLSWKRRQ